MKKVILKSVIITLCILVAFFTASTVILTSFFPKMVSDMAFKVNAKNTCVTYQEKTYLKDDSFENLATLTERCIWANDDTKIIIYAEKLLNDENFDPDLSTRDEGYAYYVTSALVIALYNEGFVEKSIETINLV